MINAAIIELNPIYVVMSLYNINITLLYNVIHNIAFFGVGLKTE